VHLRDRPSLFKNSLKVSMLLQIFMTLLQNTKFDFEKKKKSNESQSGPALFWNPLAFIIWTTIFSFACKSHV